MQVETKKWLDLKSKDWKFWVKTVGVLVVLSIFYSVGSSTAKEEIAGEKVNYEKIVAAIEKIEGELAAKESELATTNKEIEDAKGSLESVKADISANQSIIDEAKEVLDDKAAVQAEIASLNSQIGEKESEIAKLDSSIESKSAELARLESGIVKKNEEPKRLPSGTFIVGQDLPPGRYVASPQSGSGNFFVYSQLGDLKVNVILGSSFGVSEHVFFAEEGDLIELSGMAALFTPVE